MVQRAVCCIADNERLAVPVVEALQKSGFSGNEVSVIASGPLRSVFPTMPAQSMNSTLTGIGIAESDARRFEGKVSQGGVLISVRSDDPRVTDRAMAIFEHAGLRDFTVAHHDADEERSKIDSF